MLQLERLPVKWNRFTAPPILRCHPREGGDRVTPAMLRSTVGSPLEFSPAKAGPGTTGSCDSMRTKCALGRTVFIASIVLVGAGGKWLFGTEAAGQAAAARSMPMFEVDSGWP